MCVNIFDFIFPKYFTDYFEFSSHNVILLVFTKIFVISNHYCFLLSLLSDNDGKAIKINKNKVLFYNKRDFSGGYLSYNLKNS